MTLSINTFGFSRHPLYFLLKFAFAAATVPPPKE
jgi:hypothetical protein